MKNHLHLFFVIFLGLMSSCGVYRISDSSPSDYPEFTEKDSLLGFLNEDRFSYDVTYYDMDLKIEPKKKFISGKVKMHFQAKKFLNKLQIDLDPKLKIDNITDSNGKELKYRRKHTAVLVELDQEIKLGGSSFILISYQGFPKVARKPPWEGGMVWKKNKGKYFCGVSCEDDGSSIWWPGKDHISDKPDSIKVSYTVPEGHMCVANGRLTEHQKFMDGYEKYTWETSYPINNYNVTFYIGDFKHITLPFDNSNTEMKTLDFYVLPEHESVARNHFQEAVEVLEAYEELFGPYPWPKDGFKLVESPYEGMEHQTAIAYGSAYKTPSWQNYDYIIIHEIAHEWWGNSVTACDMGDLWIHEGFATYAEMLCEERNIGYSAYESSYLVNRMGVENKRPVQGPRHVFYSNYKDNDIYNKGAVFLYMLRKTIPDDSVFMDIMKTFATEYTNECVYTEDFMKLVRTKTGMNFDWMFEQYIFRAEAPELLYAYGEYDGKTEFRYKWNPEKTNENFKLRISVTIDGKKYNVLPSYELQKIELPLTSGEQALIDQDDFVIFKEERNL